MPAEKLKITDPDRIAEKQSDDAEARGDWDRWAEESGSQTKPTNSQKEAMAILKDLSDNPVAQPETIDLTDEEVRSNVRAEAARAALAELSQEEPDTEKEHQLV